MTSVHLSELVREAAVSPSRPTNLTGYARVLLYANMSITEYAIACANTGDTSVFPQGKTLLRDVFFHAILWRMNNDIATRRLGYASILYRRPNLSSAYHWWRPERGYFKQLALWPE